jgi:hypothetical protein
MIIQSRGTQALDCHAIVVISEKTDSPPIHNHAVRRRPLARGSGTVLSCKVVPELYLCVFPCLCGLLVPCSLALCYQETPRHTVDVLEGVEVTKSMTAAGKFSSVLWTCDVALLDGKLRGQDGIHDAIYVGFVSIGRMVDLGANREVA